jgi:hypothetical protein
VERNLNFMDLHEIVSVFLSGGARYGLADEA